MFVYHWHRITFSKQLSTTSQKGNKKPNKLNSAFNTGFSSVMSRGWPLRVCHVQTQASSNSGESKEFHMPVFVFVATKFKAMPNMKPVSVSNYFVI